MGQAKRRKEKLGDAYGTPEGSNRSLVAYKGFDQSEMDIRGQQVIRRAQAAGEPVVLIGTEAARPLATAVGLPWLHELPDGAPVPQQVAWDPIVAMAGGPAMPKPDPEGRGVVVLGAGTSRWLEQGLAARSPYDCVSPATNDHADV